VSWLYYSDRLAYFPLGVFGVALATVVLPQLSRHHAANAREKFVSTLDWGIRCNLLIGVPAAVAMLVLAGPLIVSLFHYGKFTVHDVLMTQRSVIAYGIGLPAFMLVKVLSSGFYAKQNIKTPVRIAIITLSINMVLNAVFVFGTSLAHAGLALATSLASWFNVGLLIWLLRRHEGYTAGVGWWKFLVRLIIANTLFATFLWSVAGDLSAWLVWHWLARFWHVCLIGFGGIAIYIICLFGLGMRLKDFKI
jgi:putative peptidoglycan lipid II flippase